MHIETGGRRGGLSAACEGRDQKKVVGREHFRANANWFRNSCRRIRADANLYVDPAKEIDMTELLHIKASPRADLSHSGKAAAGFIKALETHRPGLQVREVDVWQADLPAGG